MAAAKAVARVVAKAAAAVEAMGSTAVTTMESAKEYPARSDQAVDLADRCPGLRSDRSEKYWAKKMAIGFRRWGRRPFAPLDGWDPKIHADFRN